MKEKIKHYLEEIEKEKDIRVLLACETGSRAWGFPSPDSDYDIRMIYVHKREWYLSLTKHKDTIERMFENNDIDITGWELKKALRLLGKSNAAFLERIQSPILYKHDDDFLKEVRLVASNHYSKIATIHHYLNMGKRCFYEIENQKKYKLKKFFYALRAATACKWILDRDEIPPIVFQEMMQGLEIEEKIKERVNELIELKAEISESYLHFGEEAIFAFIQKNISQAKENFKSLPAAQGRLEDLNIFFRKQITE